MSTTLFQRPEFGFFSRRGIRRRYCKSRRVTCVINQNLFRKFNPPSSLQQKHEEFSLELQTSISHQHGILCGMNRMEFQCSEEECTSGMNRMEFESSEEECDVMNSTEIQRSEEECDGGMNRMDFGQFMAREAILDEEYWTAAWLRAEGRWENRPNERYADSYKKQFAEQEFNAIKKRCRAPHIEKCICIIVEKKEETNMKVTPIESVVGTVDLSIRHLLQGQTFPEEPRKAPMFFSINRTSPHRYGYVANLSVAKFARRQGVARNMMHFAIETAKSNGVEEVFVHVHRENKPARELYQKMGFQIVQKATPHLASEKLYLLLFKT